MEDRIAEIVKGARGDMTMKDLAEALGVSRAAISHMENGRGSFPAVVGRLFVQGRITSDEMEEIHELSGVDVRVPRLFRDGRIDAATAAELL